MATDNAALAYFGGLQYVQTHQKNAKVIPLVTNSGDSGTMSDAQYFSRISVKTEDAPQYMTSGSLLHRQHPGQALRLRLQQLDLGIPVPILRDRRLLLQEVRLVQAHPHGSDRGRPGQVLQPGSLRRLPPGIRGGLAHGQGRCRGVRRRRRGRVLGSRFGPAEHPGRGLQGQRRRRPSPSTRWPARASRCCGPSRCSTAPSAPTRGLFTADEQKKIVAALTASSTSMNTAIFPPL